MKIKSIVKNSLPFFWFTIVPIVSSFTLLLYLVNFSQIESFSVIQLLLLFLLSSLAMGFAIVPTTFTAIAFGVIGGWKLFPLLVLSYSLASIIGFTIGRKTNPDFWLKLIKSTAKGEKFLLKTSENSNALLIFSCRLSPVLPFGLSNVLMGILNFNFKNFLLFGTLGMLPRTLTAFWLGTQSQNILLALQQKNELPVFQYSLVALFILSSYLLFRLIKKSIL